MVVNNNLKRICDMIGIDPNKVTTLTSDDYRKCVELVSKIFNSTDISRMNESLNEFKDFLNCSKNSVEIKEESSVKNTTSETASVTNTGKLRKFTMIPWTISAEYDKSYSAWSYKFVTPGVNKDNVKVSYDKNKRSLSVSVTNDYTGNSYIESIIVDTYNRDVKNIKYRVVNGVTEICLFLKERDEFSIEYYE